MFSTYAIRYTPTVDSEASKPFGAEQRGLREAASIARFVEPNHGSIVPTFIVHEAAQKLNKSPVPGKKLAIVVDVGRESLVQGCQVFVSAFRGGKLTRGRAAHQALEGIEVFLPLIIVGSVPFYVDRGVCASLGALALVIFPGADHLAHVESVMLQSSPGLLDGHRRV